MRNEEVDEQKTSSLRELNVTMSSVCAHRVTKLQGQEKPSVYFLKIFSLCFTITKC